MHRRSVFSNDSVALSTIDHFLRTAIKESFAVLAYCVMPDHMHLLVEGTADRSDLCRFVKLAKQRSGSTFARKHGSRLWQEGYFDHVLRSDEDSISMARYVVGNPVRAGLVNSPSEYPYLGSGVWTVDELIDGVRTEPGTRPM